MKIAILSSKRSKDPHTQVGACLVTKENRILSAGYNGAPNGFSDDEFPWGNNRNDILNSKYPFVCHAELNCILNYRGNSREIDGAKLYVTMHPCNECAKLIIQSGIKEVYFLQEPQGDEYLFKATKILFNKCSITCKKIKVENELL